MKFTRQDSLSVVLLSLVLGLFTDTLIRQTIFGLNFLLWTLCWLFIASILGYLKKKFTVKFIIYSSLAVVNSVLVYVRSEIVVQFWSVLIVLILFGLIAGHLYIDNFTRLPLIKRFAEYIAGTITSLIVGLKLMNSSVEIRRTGKLRVEKGLVIALMLAVVFIALFASSDTVFRSNFTWLGNIMGDFGRLLQNFNVGRLFTIAFFSVTALSTLLMLMLRKGTNPDESPIGLKKVLSEKDSRVILATLVAIFGFFVLIQLRYLFTGSELPDGLTYAEYARRGYGELLIATLLASSVVQLVVSTTKRVSGRTHIYLAGALMALNTVIVLSAWKRLSLYESSYGWTMTRFVARLGLIAIILGCVSLFVWLWGKISSKQLFSTAWYIVVLTLTVAAVFNPAGIITTKNITERDQREVQLDSYFTLRQSRDSWPALCKYAKEIKETYPIEYAELTTTETLANNLYYPKGYFDTYLVPSRPVSRGLSAHYTRNASYIEKYSKCLP